MAGNLPISLNAHAATSASDATSATRSTQGSSASAAISENRSQQNISIVQASISVSISSGNEPLALLLKSAIQGINEALAPEFGPDALQNAMSQDNSPEGTAGRILSTSTGFFDAYAQQHPEKDAETLVKDFVDLIRGGFEKGFQEASDILQGLGVLSGDIKAGIDKTYGLVQKGYDDFIASKTAELTQASSAAASETKTA